LNVTIDPYYIVLKYLMSWY